MLYGTFRAFDASDFDMEDCIEVDESDLTADDSSTPDPHRRRLRPSMETDTV